jgi:hypothetical protein
MAHKEGLLGVFTYVDDLLLALRKLKEGSYAIERVHSPLHLPEVEEILGKKPSTVRIFTLLGGIVGGLGVTALAVYSHLSFSLITSGKPVLPWVPWVVVCFEGAILGAVLSAVAAWVFKGGLPRLQPAKGYDSRFSQDRFGILVACAAEEQEQVRKVLERAGAEEVQSVDW